MSAPHAFPVTESDTLYVGRILALRRDQVVMPGGQVAAREVIEHPGAVAVVALDDDGSVVMIDQYRHPVGRRLRELPAGLLDTAGEDPYVTARRELVEEIGCTARDWSVLVDVVPSGGCSDEAVRVFLARGLREVGRPTGPDDEEADLEVIRLPLVEAVHQVLAGEIVNAATVSGLLAAHAVLTGVAQPRPVDAPWPDRPRRFADRRG
ncbi:MAG: NUDIX domain-containing protein [Pseudonocardiaceae bacterium]